MTNKQEMPFRFVEFRPTEIMDWVHWHKYARDCVASVTIDHDDHYELAKIFVSKEQLPNIEGDLKWISDPSIGDVRVHQLFGCVVEVEDS